MKTFYACMLAYLANEASAAIKADGPWTGKDHTTNGVKIVNGIPTSDDTDLLHFLRSPLSLDTDINNYLNLTNVKRVKSIFKAEDWPGAFPYANSVYNYDDFLKAVGKFPAFCNETALQGWSLEDTCRRELATLFAHWGQETGYRSGA